MFKNNKMQYVIKTVSSDNTQDLQNLLNEMSMNGWELYSMQEVETDEGFVCNCIFMSEMGSTDKNDDIINISSFRSQMEKMLSPELTPYEVCLDIQGKIRAKQEEISKTKAELEGEAPASVSRKKLNDKISAGLKELEELRQKLAEATSPEQMFAKLHEDKLSIQLSEELLGYIDPEHSLQDEELVAQTVKTRLELTEGLGFVIPKILFRDDENLNPFEFSINIRGLEVFKAQVYPNYVMYYSDELKLDKKIKNSIYDVDAITGKDIVWIEKEKTKSFWEKGISGSEYIAKALEYVAVKQVDDLLDYEELENYVEVVNKKNSDLVEDIIPDFISMSDLRFILASLVRERVSIKDILYIFERINDFAQENLRHDLLKKIRLSMSRRICKQNMNEDGVITAIEISDKTIDSMAPDFDEDDNAIVRIDANFAEKLVAKIEKKAKQVGLSELKIIAPLEFRTLLFALLSNYFCDVTVLAREEIGCSATLEILGEV